MVTTFTRVVTTIDSEGKSVFLDDSAPPSSVTLGLTIHNVWGTADGVPQIGPGAEPAPVPAPFFPGPAGSRFVIVQFPPASDAHGQDDPEAAAEAVAAAERDQPGLVSSFDPDDPGFHTTDSVDYGFCIDGELWLVLGDGQERQLTAGTLVVQRGTRHAWQNRSDRPCTMLFAIIGAQRS